MIGNMEWYRSFYFAAKFGSLSKAAEALFVTQPAITYAIKQLESSLGGQLFFRTSKGVKLTTEGQILFKYIEQAYNFIQMGENKITEMHQLLNGEIKIGAGDTLCKYYLLPYLNRYHQSFPEIKIQVTNRTSRETISLLKEGSIDCGIINLPVLDNRLQIRESVQLEDCFIAGAQYESLSKEPVPLSRLVQFPLILLESGSVTRAHIDHFFARHGIIIKPEIELGSIDLLLEFAKSGLGIACVIKNFIKDELQSPALFEIKLQETIPPRRVGIITLKDVPLSSAASRFINMLP